MAEKLTGTRETKIFAARFGAGIDVSPVALLIYQPHGRDGFDANLPRECIVPFQPVNILRPFHLMAEDKPIER